MPPHESKSNIPPSRPLRWSATIIRQKFSKSCPHGKRMNSGRQHGRGRRWGRAATATRTRGGDVIVIHVLRRMMVTCHWHVISATSREQRRPSAEESERAGESARQCRRKWGHWVDSPLRIRPPHRRPRVARIDARVCGARACQYFRSRRRRFHRALRGRCLRSYLRHISEIRRATATGVHPSRRLFAGLLFLKAPCP